MAPWCHPLLWGRNNPDRDLLGDIKQSVFIGANNQNVGPCDTVKSDNILCLSPLYSPAVPLNLGYCTAGITMKLKWDETPGYHHTWALWSGNRSACLKHSTLGHNTVVSIPYIMYSACKVLGFIDTGFILRVFNSAVTLAMNERGSWEDIQLFIHGLKITAHVLHKCPFR